MAPLSTKIIDFSVYDIRFPTSLEQHGSDAMHTDPDYSCAYVIISTDDGTKGHGFSFTIGKGTDIVVKAIKVLEHLCVSKKVQDIFNDFSTFWTKLTNHTQLRWVGPEKGVIHLATAAIINALWDLWGKLEGKPVWKLLSDMTSEQIVSLIDFRYLTDALTPQEALDILKANENSKQEKIEYLNMYGYPAYTTAVAWLGYSDERVEILAKKALRNGWTRFKAKVGVSVEDDVRRLKKIRETIGEKNVLMIDANQRWDVDEAVKYMQHLLPFKPLWIEEPTSPDDVLGHAFIAKALKSYGIGVATGEQCHNRVMFKQFLQAEGMQFCQIDACRLAGPNEIIAVLLMAKKFNVPVCPHAGGVGLCELVQHMSYFDYICVSASMENRVVEYVDHLHEHFTTPTVIKNGSYFPPSDPGYSSEMKTESILSYEYPNGSVWQHLFKEGKFRPT